MGYYHCVKHDEDGTNGCESCLKEQQAACEHTWKCTVCDKRAPRLQTVDDCRRAADRLLAAYLQKNDEAYPSTTSTLELMVWAKEQAKPELLPATGPTVHSVLADRIEEQALLLSNEGVNGYSDILQAIANDLRVLGAS